MELTFKIEDEQIEKHLEEMNLYPEDGFLTLSRRLMGRSQYQQDQRRDCEYRDIERCCKYAD